MEPKQYRVLRGAASIVDVTRCVIEDLFVGIADGGSGRHMLLSQITTSVGPESGVGDDAA